MYRLRSSCRYLGGAVALALFCTAVIPATGEKPSVTTEQETDSLSKAEHLTRDGLLSGIAGEAEIRDASLRRAQSLAPDYGLARWHTGQIREGDQWLTIEQIEQQMAGDPQLEKYRELRDAAIKDPRRELVLANWCWRHDLRGVGKLHFQRVLANASAKPAHRKQAMDRLGLEPYAGTFLPKDQIKKLEAQLAQERKDQTKWAPIAEKWRDAIESGPGQKRRHAIEELQAVTDPAAIPTLETLLSPCGEDLALLVVYVLGNIPEHEATQSLVLHAIDAPTKSVRDIAIQKLTQRTLHDYIPLVLDRLTAPVQSRFSVNVGPDGLIRHTRQIFREGPQGNQLLTSGYIGGPQFYGKFNFAPRLKIKETNERTRLERTQQLDKSAAIRRAVFLQESLRAKRMQRDIANTNVQITQANDRSFEVLERTTGKNLPRSPVAWWEYWQDYNEIYRGERPTYRHQVNCVDTHYVPWTIVRMSCFPAGTQVRTETGLANIEQIQVGDRVLSQDLETGELAYKLVLQTTTRPPSELLRITIGDAAITTTLGHPFWVNDAGWRMAKRLEIGQQLHGPEDSLVVESIEPVALPAEAFNLVVADYATYFVGESGVLVHDNTFRAPTAALTPGLLATRETAPR